MTQFNIENVPTQKGRTAIVTGANTGLGFETALALAKKEMKVIMACRSRERAEKARARIESVVAGADVEVMLIDLSSLASVRQFASNFLKKYDKLDLLINNAGIMVPPYSKTVDGFESQMGANYFGHFLLTGLLLDTIKKTPGSRVVSLSSLAHNKGVIDFDNLHWDRDYSPWGAYRQSKIACLLFAYELQRRLERSGSSTISVAAHPGVTITDLPRNYPKLLQYTLLPIISLFMHSPAKGALPTLYAALGDDVRGGDFFGPMSPSEWRGEPGKVASTPYSHDEDVAGRLWTVSEELTGLKYL